MRFAADLHIHSRFSRATSRSLTLPELHVWAQRKGIALLGTGDVTHPEWFAELSEQLVEAEPGLYRLRPDLARQADERVPPACRGPVRFVLQGEVSSIYRHRDAVRKVHNVVYLPELETAGRFLGTLDRLGNVRSDGRPILGLSSREVLEILLESGPGTHLVPAHVWTPWFSLLGSKSGYDAVEECFEDLSGEIFALETGLSSDPAMNWRVSSLDRFALISCSDAHSPANLGREACLFDLDPSYPALFESLRSREGLLGTIEFFPEEGKYHLDGHRKCGVRLTPAQTREAGGVCPVCGGKLTVGVLHRVEELADRPEGARPPGARPFQRLVPLAEAVAEALGVGSRTKRVQGVCERLAREVGPEMAVLRDVPVEEVARVAGPVVAEAVRRVRAGELRVEGGYDGEFGTVRIFEPDERRELAGQGTLFATPRRDAGAQERPGPRPAGPPSAPSPVPGPEPVPGEDLNPEQRRAVEAPPGPLAVIAGPGTGKTRTLIRRIAHGVASGRAGPGQVLAVTFTNRAAGEMRERLEGLLGGDAREVTVVTLHRLGLRILREEHQEAGLPRDFRLVGRDEALELLREATGAGAREAEATLEALSRWKRGGRLPPELRDAARDYARALEARGALDLDDLVGRARELLETRPAARARWQERFRMVAVDEFQDLDPAQYGLLRAIAPGGADITVIGDPDQSIYGFRGADPGLLGRFLEDRPGTAAVRLVRNYRSAPSVIRAATRVLRPGGEPAGLVPVREGGGPVRRVEAATGRDEAEFIVGEVERLVGGTSHRSSGRALAGEGTITFGDVAVLCRVRAQLRPLEEAFGRAGLPFQTAGDGNALVRGPGRRVAELLGREPRDGPAPARVRAALEGAGVAPGDPLAGGWLAAAAAAGSVGELLDSLALHEPGDGFVPRGERVALLTLHAAKGLEFPVVFVTGCEEGLLPYRKGGGREDPEEERRLLYVGMTRARDALYLTRARRRTLFGATARPGPSPFVAALDGEAFPWEPAGDRAAGPRRRQLSLFGR